MQLMALIDRTNHAELSEFCSLMVKDQNRFELYLELGHVPNEKFIQIDP